MIGFASRLDLTWSNVRTFLDIFPYYRNILRAVGMCKHTCWNKSSRVCLVYRLNKKGFAFDFFTICQYKSKITRAFAWKVELVYFMMQAVQRIYIGYTHEKYGNFLVILCAQYYRWGDPRDGASSVKCEMKVIAKNKKKSKDTDNISLILNKHPWANFKFQNSAWSPWDRDNYGYKKDWKMFLWLRVCFKILRNRKRTWIQMRLGWETPGEIEWELDRKTGWALLVSQLKLLFNEFENWIHRY